MQTSPTHSWFSLSLLWFGAAVSVAEILTGGLLASAGIEAGLWAIVTGHLVGVVLLGLVALIGYREKMPSIMCTRISFGERGSWFLSLANVLQLIGWTAVMIQQSGRALGGIAIHIWNIEATSVSILVMGGLIAIWTIWQAEGRYGNNTITVVLLFLLTVFVSWVLWGRASASAPALDKVAVTMSFHEAFELSLVMPLSWVPLVADYASRARSAKSAALAPAFGYLVGSLWMYGIGFAGALFTGEADPTPMLLAAGLGVAALGIVILSTVTTTFLDVYSAVVSARNVSPRLPEKSLGIAVVVLGTVAALILDSELYISFLLLIGAVFVPLSAILLTDYFLLRLDFRHRRVDAAGLFSLGTGILAYFAFTIYGSPAGPAMSCIALTLVVHLFTRWVSAKYAFREGVREKRE